MTQPWGQRPTRRCHRISPHRLIIWRGAKPLLCKDAPHAGQGGQAVGRRARSARTASTRWTARTRAACHAARISAGSEGASSTARSRRCISRSSSRMLSCRHSIGHRPPLETLVRGSKSVPHFRCYASPPPTKTCAPTQLKQETPITPFPISEKRQIACLLDDVAQEMHRVFKQLAVFASTLHVPKKTCRPVHQHNRPSL